MAGSSSRHRTVPTPERVGTPATGGVSPLPALWALSASTSRPVRERWETRSCVDWPATDKRVCTALTILRSSQVTATGTVTLCLKLIIPYKFYVCKYDYIWNRVFSLRMLSPVSGTPSWSGVGRTYCGTTRPDASPRPRLDCYRTRFRGPVTGVISRLLPPARNVQDDRNRGRRIARLHVLTGFPGRSGSNMDHGRFQSVS